MGPTGSGDWIGAPFDHIALRAGDGFPREIDFTVAISGAIIRFGVISRADQPTGLRANAPLHHACDASWLQKVVSEPLDVGGKSEVLFIVSET